MTEVAAGPDIQVGISNLSLPISVQYLGDVSATERYLGSIGGDDGIVPLEITPTQTVFPFSPFMRGLIRRGRLLQALDGAGHVPSIETAQSGVEEDDLQSMIEDRPVNAEIQAMARMVMSVHSSPRDARKPGLDLKGRLVFPHFEYSIQAMGQIQRAVGKDLPAVFYPGLGMGPYNYDARFNARSFQPKPDDWKQHMRIDEAASPDVMRKAMHGRHFNSVTLDVFHVQNPQRGEEFMNPIDLTERLSRYGLVHGVHLALGRLDCAEDSRMKKQTMEAKAAFIESADAADKTVEGQMLKQIVLDWNTPPDPKELDGLTTDHGGQLRRVIIEVLPSASTREAKKEHRAIVENVRELINSVPRP